MIKSTKNYTCSIHYFDEDGCYKSVDTKTNHYSILNLFRITNLDRRSLQYYKMSHGFSTNNNYYTSTTDKDGRRCVLKIKKLLDYFDLSEIDLLVQQTHIDNITINDFF